MKLTVWSGGQTGVDRAALDAAIELGIPHGGWCPRGRKAEDGPLHSRYQLRETEASGYEVRTEFNVRGSDATLLLFRGPASLSGGTLKTERLAKRSGRPCWKVDLAIRGEPVVMWAARSVGLFMTETLVADGALTLNVAGPRESKCPGIYAEAKAFLLRALAPWEAK